MWLDNASDIDILFYEPYARIISDIAKNKDYNPLTIGVFGLWGAGKSTLLKLINHKIQNEEKIVCVSINAWMFESYEDSKTAIMEALLQELKEKLPVDEAKKKMTSLLKRVDWFKFGTKTIATLAPIAASMATGNPLPLLLNLPTDATKIGDTVKNAANSLQEIKDEYWKEDVPTSEESVVSHIRKFREEFALAIEKSGINNIVVMIDDLDRCRPERIIDILEAIKLFLAVEKTTFIIAADENVIKYSIRGKYPPMNGFEVELDKEYIEKIIQLPIYIPELSAKDIQNYLLLLVAQSCLSEENFKKLIDEVFEKKLTVSGDVISLGQLNTLIDNLDITFDQGAEKEYKEISTVIDEIRNIVAYTLKGNPRQAKRFLNTFITKRQLAQIYYGEDLDMAILAKLLVLQKIDNNLFVQLNEWNKAFDTENRKFKEMRNSVENGDGKGYEAWLNPQVKKWLKCKPVELEKQLLDKYFYLTRENLTRKDVDESSFSSNTKYILARVGSATSGLIQSIITEAKTLSPEEIKDVLNVLISKIEKGELKFFIIREFYVHFETYRERIASAISKSNVNVRASEMAALRTMYQTDSDNLKIALDEMHAKGTLTKETLLEIKQQ